MTIDSNAIVTATEANQNFSRVAKLAENWGMWSYSRITVRSCW